MFHACKAEANDSSSRGVTDGRFQPRWIPGFTVIPEFCKRMRGPHACLTLRVTKYSLARVFMLSRYYSRACCDGSIAPTMIDRYLAFPSIGRAGNIHISFITPRIRENELTSFSSQHFSFYIDINVV